MSEVLTERYRAKSDHDLKLVLENQEKFTPEAVLVAANVLKERGVELSEPEEIKSESESESSNPTASPEIIPTDESKFSEPEKAAKDYRSLSDEKVRDQYKSQHITVKGLGTYLVVTSLLVLGSLPNITFGNSIGQQMLTGFFCLLFIMLLASGIQLFRKRSSGLVIGIFALLPFIINFGIPGFLYQTGTMLDLSLIIIPPVNVNLTFLNSFFSVNLGSDIYFLKLNFVPIIAFSFLFDLYDRVDSDEIDDIWYSK